MDPLWEPNFKREWAAMEDTWIQARLASDPSYLWLHKITSLLLSSVGFIILPRRNETHSAIQQRLELKK
jgi:hypothetical protein